MSVYGGVWVFGSKVVLFMGSGMFAGDLVEVSYTRSGYRYWNHNGPLTDPYHNYVANFSGQAANNLESGPEVASAEADGTRLTVTFNETIDPCCKGQWRVKTGEGSSEQTITVRDAGTTVAGNALTPGPRHGGRRRPAGPAFLSRRQQRGRRAGPGGQYRRALLRIRGDQRHGGAAAVRERRGGRTDADRHLRQDPGRDVCARARRLPRHRGQRPAQCRRAAASPSTGVGREAHPGVGGE